VFVSRKHLKLGPIYASNIEAMALPANIRPSWKGFTGANRHSRLFCLLSITKKKCFVRLTPGDPVDRFRIEINDRNHHSEKFPVKPDNRKPKLRFKNRIVRLNRGNFFYHGLPSRRNIVTIEFLNCLRFKF